MKRVVAALICKDGKLKWEFPGGKIEEGEQPRDAMHRELEEELGIDATVGDEVTRLRHEYPNGASVELRFFVVREYAGELENRIFRDIQWANPSDLPSYDFLEADRKLVEDLAAGKIL
jgi:8-oxo-dGTP diphosphatase